MCFCDCLMIFYEMFMFYYVFYEFEMVRKIIKKSTVYDYSYENCMICLLCFLCFFKCVLNETFMICFMKTLCF